VAALIYDDRGPVQTQALGKLALADRGLLSVHRIFRPTERAKVLKVPPRPL
jgi:hypothetical protein